MQAQYERHAAQAAVAQTAKVQLRKETEWMRRQPKARSTKSKSRQDAFYELSDVARSGPKKDVKADFGAGAMSRQVAHCPGLSSFGIAAVLAVTCDSALVNLASPVSMHEKVRLLS